MFDSMPKTDFMKDNKGLLEKALTFALLAGLGVAGWYLLPYLIIILQNLLWTTGLVVGLIIALKVVFNKTLQRAVMLLIDNMALRAQKLVVESDPFSTAQNMIKRLVRRKEELRTYVGNLRGALDNVEKSIKVFENKREQALAYAKAALDDKNHVQLKRYSNTAKRYEESIARLTPIKETTKALYTFLSKMLELCGAQIEEQEEALSIALQEYRIAEQSKEAVGAAQAAMSGEDFQMFNQAMDAIAFNTQTYLGEVELFMDMTQPLLDAKDFENRAKTDQAVEEFKKWLQQDTALMGADEKQALLRTVTDTPEMFMPKSNPAQLAAAPQSVALLDESSEETEDELRDRRARADKFNLLDRR